MKQTPKLEQISIIAWLLQHQIKVEQGMPLNFKDHLFLYDPYRDLSPKQAILKAAQIGFSTLAINKSLWVSKNLGMDIIYTLPTEGDMHEFVGGKVNRIIAQNPVLQEYVRDKDTIEQKRVGDNIIYYKGTWTEKAAIMVSSDLNIYDEVDASKQDIIEQYSTRLQHSRYQWEWYFSHPSSEGTGVHKYWTRSDQKHWFVRCRSCNKEQFLSWPDSIDPIKRRFQCKYCSGEISDNDRRTGRWVAKYKNREYSGYWIPLLICPWVSAGKILDYYRDKDGDYFYNKVLGLPYVGGGNKLTKPLLMNNLTPITLYPDKDDRVVIGMDTGKKLHYVVGNEKGIFYYSEATDYDEIRTLMDRWPRAILVVDQGGDLIGSRKMRQDYPGRVYLCSYGADRKTQELVRWGAKDESGTVIVDRNRMIQLVVDEFTDQRIPLQGTEEDWFDYWLHWNNLTRIKEENEQGIIKRVWVRSGDDHWAHATAYWRVGMTRFAIGGSIYKPTEKNNVQKGYRIHEDDTVKFDPDTFFQKDEEDWRDN